MSDYLNTDLELLSPENLTPLVAAFEERGLLTLHAGQVDEAAWEANLETEAQYDAPKPNIAAILAVVEALPEPMKAIWAGCTHRRFSIGYDGGNEPRALQQMLSNQLLGQIAALGAMHRHHDLRPDRLVASWGAPECRIWNRHISERKQELPRFHFPTAPDWYK